MILDAFIALVIFAAGYWVGAVHENALQHDASVKAGTYRAK